MHLEKLTTRLKSFDEPRLKRLSIYVSSPYFRVPPVSVILLKRLTALHPTFPENKMQPEKLGKNSPTLSTPSKQSAAGSHLLSAIEGFIALEEWQKDEAVVTRCLLKGFKELSLTDEFEKRNEKEIAQLVKSPEQNPDTFFERHALTELSFNGFDAKLNRTAQNDIMPIVKTLDEFYALKKLRYLCEALNRKQFFGVNYRDENIPALLKILEPYTNPKSTYVYLFVNVYHMMVADTYEDSDLYYQLIKQVALRSGPSSTMCEVMTYAINQCLYWYNKGYEEAGNEYLWWIEWKMKHHLLLEKGKLMPITFRNVINIAVSNKKNPVWINQWVNEYAQYLPDEHADTNLAFAKGLYHYAIRQYKEAIRFFLLAQVKDEVLFNGNLRLWEWMCLYECDRNDTDTLFNHLLAFEKYLHRNKKELQHLSGMFERFIDYSTKLLNTINSETLNHHITELQNEEHFPRKYWLMHQFAAKNQKPVPHKTGRVEVLIKAP